MSNTGEQTRIVDSRNPTIRYDSERSVNSVDGLAPPDVNEIMQRRSYWKRFKSMFTNGNDHGSSPDGRGDDGSRRVTMVMTCLSITLSSLQANGVYCWPTYGPVVARMMDLTGPQAQAIAVGGILGVYLMAAPLGSLTDRKGTRFGSLVSAGLSAAGYLSFALLLRTATPDTPYIHIWLTLAFCLVGAATVGSYFACLTCASLSFPQYPTLSLSVPLSLLGLSSLFLSSFSSITFFLTPKPDSELIPIRFVIFLGILCPSINLFASVFMQVIPPAPIALKPDTGDDSEDEEEADSLAEARMSMSQSLHLDEHSPILIGGYEAALEEIEAMQRGKRKQWTAWNLVKDWEGFWVFGIILAMCIGPSETIIASIGSILTSLLPPSTSLSPVSALQAFTSATNPLTLRNKHVSILSLTSTLSRLAAGALADYLCPPLQAVKISNPGTPSTASDAEEIPTPHTHKFIRKRPVILYRSMFASICSIALALILAWCAGILQTEKGLWVLSAGVGTAYGSLFTLSPAIVSAHYGPTSFGLAWGMVSYFAALGSVLFSALYAMISASRAEKASAPAGAVGVMAKAGNITCYGPECFQPALWVAMGCSLVACVGFFFIGKRWRV